MKRSCEGCGHALDERMMYQMVTGWQRRGHSNVTGKRFEQRWACKPCVEAFSKTGEVWKQDSLFPVEP